MENDERKGSRILSVSTCGPARHETGRRSKAAETYEGLKVLAVNAGTTA